MDRSATALSWGDAGQSSVAAISVVVNFVAIELPFQIALVPKQSLIEVFPPDGPDQSLNERCERGVPGRQRDFHLRTWNRSPQWPLPDVFIPHAHHQANPKSSRAASRARRPTTEATLDDRGEIEDRGRA